MAACPPKSVPLQVAFRSHDWAALSWLLLLGKQKKQLAHLLINNYEVKKSFVCDAQGTKLDFNGIHQAFKTIQR